MTSHDKWISALSLAVSQNMVTVLYGPRDRGQREAVFAAVTDRHPPNQVLSCDGNWFAGGYLAGFEKTIKQAFDFATLHCPSLLEQHQQTLKRLYPHMESAHFTIAKDLTNTSCSEERTRFYHHEYQNKLLVGLAEFLIKVQQTQNFPRVLIIDRADALSPTAQSLLHTIQRLDGGSDAFKFVLLDYDHKLFFPDALEMPFHRYTEQELLFALALEETYPVEKMRRVFIASRGNLSCARAIIECDKAGIAVVGYIDPEALVDFFLTTRTPEQRKAMLLDYIDQGCKNDDCILARNYQTYCSQTVDREHRRRHADSMENYFSGKAPLVTLHAQLIRDKRQRLEALAEPSEILKGIGLYDTWFSYFAEIFADADLRKHGSGNDPANAILINAAFVLYSLGCGSVSVPYLEEFYQRFPESRYTPTVLYAQSMTYGRYQQPVNLPLAERYALKNLQVIDSNFKSHKKYDYIKVFAENAYAYIKARQGHYKEALALCSSGERRMRDIYGSGRFKLHQSILIYNTSQIYEITKDYERAERQLRMAMAYDPSYGEYYNDLGNLLVKFDGRESEALAAYQQAIDLCPPYHEAYLNRGVLLARLEHSEAALSDFKRCLEIKPHEPRAYFEIGNIQLSKANYSEALAAYRRAAEIEPNNPDLQSNIGLAFSEMNNPMDSVNHYRRAIALQPDHAISHNNLAIELYNLRQFDEAMEHAGKAVSLGGDPDYEMTRNFIHKQTVA